MLTENSTGKKKRKKKKKERKKKAHHQPCLMRISVTTHRYSAAIIHWPFLGLVRQKQLESDG